MEGVGPYRAEQIQSGALDEVFEIQSLQQLPAEQQKAKYQALGTLLLGSDPDVTSMVVESAFYDPKEAQRLTLRNLLQREGYAGLEDLKDRSRDEGRMAEARGALRRVFAKRKLHVASSDEARIDACSNLETLERWHDNAIDASSATDALE
jgi:hypothetical protein